MKNLILVLAGLATISACSDARDRHIAVTDNSAQRPDLTLPDTGSLSDSSITLLARDDQAVSPVEQQPAQTVKRPSKARTPSKRRTRPAPSTTPTTAAVDTSTQAYAPNAAPDTAPGRDSLTIDTAAAGSADTATAPRTDTLAAPGVDTVSASGSDTVPARTPDTTSTAAWSPDTAPAPSSGRTAALAARTLPIGTEIHAALDDSITSRRDTVGQAVSAHVMENVTGADGRTLIAAGTPVRFTVTRLAPSRSKGSQGRFTLRADGIALKGQLRPVKAEVRPVPRELRGRGVTASEVGKVGVGAAGGAVLGRVVGGNTRGAVIGGVAGAAAGAVVANQTATRDVVVKAKTPVVLVLTQPLIAP
jgi:hypothetical protein